MNGDKLLDAAEETASQLRSTAHEYPFGPDWDVFKVGGKVFLLTTQVPGRAVATLKCDPIEAVDLCKEHDEITPGYHMNKRHWISVWPGDSVDENLVRELVRNSYQLVVETLPESARP